MGWPEVAGNGRKSQEQSDDHGGRRRGFAGPIPARPAAVGRESYRKDHLDVPLLSFRRVLQVAGRWCLLWSKPPRLANGSKLA